jgi:Rrf2 family protein
MMRLSKKVEYAVIALLDMERNGNGKWLSAKEIAGRNRIPAELLGRILNRLVHAGMVESVQGVKGGFRLQRALDRIALSDVVEAVDGPVRLTCCQEDPKACGQFGGCDIRKPVLKVQQDFIKYMRGVSVASFRNAGDRARAAKWRRRGDHGTQH